MSGRIARVALRTSIEDEALVCLVMKGSRRYLFLLLATACARPAAAPPPVAPTRPPLAGARGPATPRPVALPTPRPTQTPFQLPPSATIFIGCGFLRVENHGSTTFSLVLPA